MPPCRSRAMSSMLSAPAAMPATSEQSFRPGWAPLSVGTLIRWSASSRSPALPASAISGIRPAADTRLGSSNVADTTGRVWESCIYEMPFLNWRYGPSASRIFPVQRGILAFPRLSATLSPSVDRGLAALAEGVEEDRLQIARVDRGVRRPLRHLGDLLERLEVGVRPEGHPDHLDRPLGVRLAAQGVQERLEPEARVVVLVGPVGEDQDAVDRGRVVVLTGRADGGQGRVVQPRAAASESAGDAVELLVEDVTLRAASRVGVQLAGRDQLAPIGIAVEVVGEHPQAERVVARHQGEGGLGRVAGQGGSGAAAGRRLHGCRHVEDGEDPGRRGESRQPREEPLDGGRVQLESRGAASWMPVAAPAPFGAVPSGPRKPASRTAVRADSEVSARTTASAAAASSLTGSRPARPGSPAWGCPRWGTRRPAGSPRRPGWWRRPPAR